MYLRLMSIILYVCGGHKITYRKDYECNYTKTLSLKVHIWTINYVAANDRSKSLLVHIDDVNTLVNIYCDYI